MVGFAAKPTLGTALAAYNNAVSTLSGICDQWEYPLQQISAAADPLEHQDKHPTDPLNRTSPWLSLCAKLAGELPYKTKLLVIPVAAGSSSFSNNNWNQGNTEYENMVASVNAALSNLPLMTSLRGFSWLQGESDAAANSTTYLADITAMYSALLTDITAMTDQTPFIVMSSKGATGNVSAINDSQIAFSDNQFNCYFADGRDLIAYDLNHYDTASVFTLGERASVAIRAFWQLSNLVLRTKNVTGVYEFSGVSTSVDLGALTISASSGSGGSTEGLIDQNLLVDDNRLIKAG